MAGAYFRCGYGVSQFTLHSSSSSLYPQTCSSSSYVYYSAFAATSTDCWIDNIYTTVSGTIKIQADSSTWNYASDPYISMTTSGRYITVYVEPTVTTYSSKITAGTGVSALYAHSSADSTWQYITGSHTFTGLGSSGYVYFDAVYLESGYTYPVYCSPSSGNTFTLIDSSGTWNDHYLSLSSASRNGTVYATQKTYTYTLSYNANGGSSAPSSQSYGPTTSTQHSFTVRSGTPTRSGYTFLGWSTSPSATSPSYYAGSSFTIYSANTSRTLYAVWQKTYTYTLNYNANGGSGAPSAQSYGPTTATQYSFTVLSTTPTRSGYTFLHWNTASDGTGTSYSAGDSFTIYSANTSRTLYAIWQLSTSTVTLYGNGGVWGRGTSSETSTVGPVTKTVGDTFYFGNYTGLTRYGYTLLGWSTSSSATTATWGVNGYVTVGATDATYYAVWQKKTFSSFSWTADDATNIATGQNISNITATKWNDAIDLVNDVAECWGSSFSTQYTATSGGDFTDDHYNALTTGIRSLAGAGAVTKTSVSTGENIMASYFHGTGSIKQSLNSAITYWNNNG